MAVIYRNKTLEAKLLNDINTPPNEWVEPPMLFMADLSDDFKSIRVLSKVNPDRKWELTSAYQKAIRRGDFEIALKCISAVVTIMKQDPNSDAYKYFWRRACVCVAEDIGNAHIPLCYLVVKAAVSCMKVSTPTDLGFAVLVSLTRLMCAATKSRLYCQFSIIENAYKKPSLFDNLEDDHLRFVNGLCSPHKQEESTLNSWFNSKSWLTEGMLKFGGYILNSKLLSCSEVNDVHLTTDESMMIAGLPSYCYDMHTRIGKQVLRMLLADSDLKQFFGDNHVYLKLSEFLGCGLFFVEGAVVGSSRFYYPDIFPLEMKAISKDLSALEFSNWVEFLDLMQTKVPKINSLRQTVLKNTYGGV